MKPQAWCDMKTLISTRSDRCALELERRGWTIRWWPLAWLWVCGR